MGVWIAVIVIAVVVLAAAAVPLVRRTRSAPPVPSEPEPAPRRPPAPPPSAPMTDLESALATVTDREGRPIKDRIDAGSPQVDPLRDPDDAGPLLRRALDSVEHHEDRPATDETDPRTA